MLHKCSLDYLVSKLINLKTAKAIGLTVPEKVLASPTYSSPTDAIRSWHSLTAIEISEGPLTRSTGFSPGPSRRICLFGAPTFLDQLFNRARDRQG